jgi:hypothetical protein
MALEGMNSKIGNMVRIVDPKYSHRSYGTTSPGNPRGEPIAQLGINEDPRGGAQVWV